MTIHEARRRAERLGLSAWIAHAIVQGAEEFVVERMCVGFSSAGFAIAEADTWEDAIASAMRIIFRA